MSKMIERVAAAIAVQQALPPEEWRHFLEEARAALSAMLVPGEELLRAGGDRVWENWHEEREFRDIASDAWSGMISSALAEEASA